MADYTITWGGGGVGILDYFLYLRASYNCVSSQSTKTCIVGMKFALTLIYPHHSENVQCQSGVNHIYEG